jgi:hypothetical protein
MPSFGKNLNSVTRHKGGKVSRLKRRRTEPEPQPGDRDRVFNLTEVGYRWGVTPETARKRLLAAGVPLMSFNKKSCEVLFSDLVAFEKRLLINPL